jgi:inner membrane transporter RhtA
MLGRRRAYATSREQASIPDGPPIPIGADTADPARLRDGPGVAAAIVITVGLLFQVGSALAIHVMQAVGVIEALWMRTAFAALMLIAVRPRTFRLPRDQNRLRLAALTLALLGMNLFFYAAIDRIPLGVVVTIEFLGPLTVAMLGSRGVLDWVWIVLAAAGVAVLAGPSGSADALGLVFAFAAAACWGSFILLAKRAVTHMDPLSITALMLAGSAVLLTPVLLVSGVVVRGQGSAIALGVLVSLLSSALPYRLEFIALQRVSAATYGVLLSIEPALAALIGFVLLSQRLSGVEILAIVAVAVAAGGASWTHGR